MNTAGRAVVFAGDTVVIALLGMFALGVSFLYGLAVAAAVGVLLVLAASLTLLPALLTFFGRKIGEPGRLARLRRGAAAEGRSRLGFWTRWIGVIQRRPAIAAIASTADAGARRARRWASGSARAMPATTPPNTTTQAYDLLAEGFGSGFNGPLAVAVDLPKPGRHTALDAAPRRAAATPGVASSHGRG